MKPTASSPLAIAPGFDYEHRPIVKPRFIDFDIATTVAETSNASGGCDAKISVVGVGISFGGERGVTANQESVSRVKFQVPVYFEAKNSGRE
jgi:hypothetical protein